MGAQPSRSKAPAAATVRAKATAEAKAGPDRSAPGPIYDNCLRLLAQRDPGALCAYLGIESQQAPVCRSEALPAATRYVDLLAQTGEDHYAHIEFARTASCDMALRMLEYCARIMVRHKRQYLTQHVVVLADGVMPDHLTVAPGLSLQLKITYLRDQDPEPLLASPSLAPLAVLARAADRHLRADHLRRALRAIATVEDPRHRADLVQAAATLAGIYLDPVTIETTTREADMPFVLDTDTVAGRAIAARAQARGLEQGLEQGRAQTYAVLMRRTFGDDPRIPALAARLAHLTHERALDLALGATTLDDLATATGGD